MDAEGSASELELDPTEGFVDGGSLDDEGHADGEAGGRADELA